jgi:hypothetical protein
MSEMAGSGGSAAPFADVGKVLWVIRCRWQAGALFLRQSILIFNTHRFRQ